MKGRYGDRGNENLSSSGLIESFQSRAETVKPCAVTVALKLLTYFTNTYSYYIDARVRSAKLHIASYTITPEPPLSKKKKKESTTLYQISQSTSLQMPRGEVSPPTMVKLVTESHATFHSSLVKTVIVYGPPSQRPHERSPSLYSAVVTVSRPPGESAIRTKMRIGKGTRIRPPASPL
jgi:hypothetical protein